MAASRRLWQVAHELPRAATLARLQLAGCQTAAGLAGRRGKWGYIELSAAASGPIIVMAAAWSVTGNCYRAAAAAGRLAMLKFHSGWPVSNWESDWTPCQLSAARSTYWPAHHPHCPPVGWLINNSYSSDWPVLQCICCPFLMGASQLIGDMIWNNVSCMVSHAKYFKCQPQLLAGGLWNIFRPGGWSGTEMGDWIGCQRAVGWVRVKAYPSLIQKLVVKVPSGTSF